MTGLRIAPDLELPLDAVTKTPVTAGPHARHLRADKLRANRSPAVTGHHKWQLAIDLATKMALRDADKIRVCTADVLNYWAAQWRFAGSWAPKPPLDAAESVRNWLARGLCPVDLWDLTDVTVARYHAQRGLPLENTWAYFAGCCWKRLTEREEQARKLIDEGRV